MVTLGFRQILTAAGQLPNPSQVKLGERLPDDALTVAYRREQRQDMLGGQERVERRGAACG